MKRTTLVTAWLFALAVCADAAPPKVDRMFPNGGTRGSTVTIKLTGTLDKATKVWCDRSDLKLSLDIKKKSLKITIPKTAEPGRCWLRFHNAEGASPLRAIEIDALPGVIEKEPNDSPSHAQKLKASSVIDGVLSKRGEADTFAIPVKRGQTLVASMRANRTLGSPMDGVLQIVTPRGFVLEQNDDDRGFDPQVTHTAKADGLLLVRAFAFPAMPNSTIGLAGSSTYVYRLTITTGPFLDHVSPAALKNTGANKLRLFGWNIPKSQQTQTIAKGESAIHPDGFANVVRLPIVDSDSVSESDAAKRQALQLPVVVTGHIDKPKQVDVYEFNAKKGQRLRFVAEARALGSPLDPVLRLTDAKGTLVARAETRSSTAIDETLSASIKADGRYRLEIRDLHRRGGWHYFYRLTMQPESLVATATVASDAFVVTAKKPLTIPIAVSGRIRSANQVKVAIEGLPKSVTVKPGKVRRKGRSRFLDVVLTAKAKNKFSGPIRILVTAEKRTLPAHATVAGTGLTSTRLWLTVK